MTSGPEIELAAKAIAKAAKALRRAGVTRARIGEVEFDLSPEEPGRPAADEKSRDDLESRVKKAFGEPADRRPPLARASTFGIRKPGAPPPQFPRTKTADDDDATGAEG